MSDNSKRYMDWLNQVEVDSVNRPVKFDLGGFLRCRYIFWWFTVFKKASGFVYYLEKGHAN